MNETASKQYIELPKLSAHWLLYKNRLIENKFTDIPKNRVKAT